MKKYFLLFLLLISSWSLFAQDRDAILKVLHTQTIAWNAGNIDAFMQGYWKSDSLLFVSSSTPIHGWQQTIDHYKTKYKDRAAMGTLTFTILKVDVLDKTNAFVLGGWHLKRANDAPGGYFTLWFKKINGEWKVVCDHTS